MRHVNRDRGMVTAFVVSVALVLFVAAGLALDSGRLVAARITAADHAENAARLAAQEVTGIRAGQVAIDPAKGRRAAMDYLAGHGLEGEITIQDRSATVVVSASEEMTILRLIGIPSRQVSATRTAEITDA